jgi:peptide/nickel transport system permease protein
MVPVLFLVSIFSFLIVHFAPGDPLIMYTTPGLSDYQMSEEELAALRESLGLNGTIMEQYFAWLKNTLRGNWGKSVINAQSVKNQIMQRLPATVGLMGCSLLFAVLAAIPLGLLAGICKNGWLDRIISVITYIGISVPSFWFGIMLIIVFALRLNWLPSSGMRTIGVYSISDLIRHGILPTIVLGFLNMAVFIRYIRVNVISQMGEDYVMTALSKGASQSRILFCHVLKICLLPVVTIVGMNFGSLVSGSFIVESVFGWPGLGTLGMTAINTRDYPLIMGVTMLSCCILLLGNFLADVLYGIVDPRIQYSRD